MRKRELLERIEELEAEVQALQERIATVEQARWWWPYVPTYPQVPYVIWGETDSTTGTWNIATTNTAIARSDDQWSWTWARASGLM